MVGQYPALTKFDALATHIRRRKLALTGLNPLAMLSSFSDPAQQLFKNILVDMHAEATSEKMAMGRYLDGRVSSVAGTHTHVQTADEQIMPEGTAYLTDLGMTGPHDGVIGMRTEIVLERYLRGLSAKFEPCEGGIKMNGLIVDVDEATGKALRVERLSLNHS